MRLLELIRSAGIRLFPKSQEEKDLFSVWRSCCFCWCHLVSLLNTGPAQRQLSDWACTNIYSLYFMHFFFKNIHVFMISLNPRTNPIIPMCVLVSELSHSVVSDSLWLPGLQPAKLLHPWDFSRQECLSGLPFPPPGDLPDPGIEPASPALAGGFFTTWESPNNTNTYHYSYLQIGKLRLKEIMSFAQVSNSDLGTHVSLALKWRVQLELSWEEFW